MEFGYGVRIISKPSVYRGGNQDVLVRVGLRINQTIPPFPFPSKEGNCAAEHGMLSPVFQSSYSGINQVITYQIDGNF